MNKGEIVIYQTADNYTSLEVRFENDTVWLTQAQMVDLFGRERTVITKHINNVFRENELTEESNVHFLHIAFSDKPVKYYSLDVIISVGYRIKSQRGTQFRIWANNILKNYTDCTNNIAQFRPCLRQAGTSHCPICLYASALTTVDIKMTLGHFICTVGITC